MSPFRVCLDARLHDGQHGGVQQVMAGLASALSALEGPEEYHFLITPEAGGWIRPLLGGSCRPLLAPPPRRGRRVRAFVRRARARLGPSWAYVPRSDGTIERAGIDVMHFSVQSAFLTDVPSLYQPHDLQHLHLPDCFRPTELAERTAHYRQFCTAAHTVIALSSWGRRDLLNAYPLPDDRVVVVPNAPPDDAGVRPDDSTLAAVRQRLALPDAFLLCPAATWPHKNHLGLLEALVHLRDREGLRVPLVCCGLPTSHGRLIDARIVDRALTSQVRQLGHVAPDEVRSLYHLARAVVFPSRFEGFGLPVLESLAAGTPLACAAVTSLPSLAGEAALFFDPVDTTAMAAAIARVWLDDGLRATLATRGRSRASAFSWDSTARLLRAHYRRVANRTLSEEDLALLSAPPLL